MYDGVKWIDQVWLRRSYHEKKIWKLDKGTELFGFKFDTMSMKFPSRKEITKLLKRSWQRCYKRTNAEQTRLFSLLRTTFSTRRLQDAKMVQRFFFFAFSHFFSLVSKCNHCFAKFVAAGESCAKWRLRTGSQTLSVQGPALQSQFVRGSFGNTWGMPLPRGRPSGRLLRGTSRLLKWSWLIFTFECH